MASTSDDRLEFATPGSKSQREGVGSTWHLITVSSELDGLFLQRVRFLIGALQSTNLVRSFRVLKIGSINGALTTVESRLCSNVCGPQWFRLNNGPIRPPSMSCVAFQPNDIDLNEFTRVEYSNRLRK